MTFRIADSSYTRNASGEYVEESPTFWNVQVWRKMGENLIASLKKGSRVIVTGTVKTSRYPARDDPSKERSWLYIDAQEVGASLRYATASLSNSAADVATPQPEKSTTTPQGWSVPTGTDDDAPF